jgi:UDP-N-acetylglucosamine acyltransferase
MSEEMIHPSAIIHPGAKLGINVAVGPYSIIGPHVEIGDNTWIGPHVVIRPHPDRARQRVSSSSVRSARCRRTRSTPASRRASRSVTATPSASSVRSICGTAQDVGVTRVGNDNWIMAYVHIAHDCQVGNRTIFANNAQLGRARACWTTGRFSAATPACISLPHRRA